MRVLIVEDNEALASLISRYLEPIVEERPIIAYNMQEAMLEISKFPPVDLVTLDLVLPDSNAEESLKRILELKALNPNCLIIVVTGSVLPGRELQAMASGADGFIHKTAMTAERFGFINTIRDILKSITRQPSRYQKNIPLLEKIAEKIGEYAASHHATAA